MIGDADDPWAQHDPAQPRAGLKKVSALLFREGERTKTRIYRGREEGARPITRP